MLNKESICKYMIIWIGLYIVDYTTHKDSSIYCTFKKAMEKKKKKAMGKGEYFLASVGRKCIAYL